MDVFKHRPTMISAFRWNGHKYRLADSVSSMELNNFTIHDNGMLTVMTEQGLQKCAIGDYVIRKGINNYYVCPSLDFDKLYYKVANDIQ